MRRQDDITPELVLRAYRAGLFPMAEGRDSEVIHWIDPPRRGVLPLDEFHLSRRLYRTIRAGEFQISVNGDFAATLAGCAAPSPGRTETWISPAIERVFKDLHLAGYAHSVECRVNDVLVGGLYGVAIGSAFFGESMFSTVRDASKIALVFLVALLRIGGFSLLDTQFVTSHLSQFGAREVPRTLYRERLKQALVRPGRFPTRLSDSIIMQEIEMLR